VPEVSNLLINKSKRKAHLGKEVSFFELIIGTYRKKWLYVEFSDEFRPPTKSATGCKSPWFH
jgi:hypothetical protein